MEDEDVTTSKEESRERSQPDRSPDKSGEKSLRSFEYSEHAAASSMERRPPIKVTPPQPRKQFRIPAPQIIKEKFADSQIADELDRANRRRHYISSNGQLRHRDVEFSIAGVSYVAGDDESNNVSTTPATQVQIPGDAISSAKKEKRVKRPLTAKEKNRMIYDSDMSVAMYTVDMEDLEPNKPISLDDEIASLVTANKIPAIRQYIEERKELRKQKMLTKMEAEEKLYLQMKEEHRKQKVEEGHTKYSRRPDDYKAGEKSVMAVKQLHTLRNLKKSVGGGVIDSKEMLLTRTESSVTKGKGGTGLQLLNAQIHRLEEYSRVNAPCRLLVPRELARADTSNDIYLVKNQKGKYVRHLEYILVTHSDT